MMQFDCLLHSPESPFVIGSRPLIITRPAQRAGVADPSGTYLIAAGIYIAAIGKIGIPSHCFRLSQIFFE